MTEQLTPDELRTQLARLGWSQSDFASRLDIGRDTVCRWVNGKNPIPFYAIEHIRLTRLVNLLMASRGESSITEVIHAKELP